MKQEERLDYLIAYLLSEQKEYADVIVPKNIEDKKHLLRSLMNVRLPVPISQKFLDIQDDYLKQELATRKIISVSQLSPIQTNIYLWQGDITQLQVDAIVNAGNSALLGCFIPCHNCIDNAIHSKAGIQLRLACQEIMKQQNHSEPTGNAKITKGYNLPAKYVLHTVGPIVRGTLTKEHCDMLKSCYISCLELAEKNHLSSVAFCCISTGEFCFPNEIAGKIAVDTVTQFLKHTHSEMEVVFNVFKDKDFKIYHGLLVGNKTSKKST